MPTLESHGCCYGEAGGFLKRLREGAWMGHVVEHVALELQSLVGAANRALFTGVLGTGRNGSLLFADRSPHIEHRLQISRFFR